MGLAPRTLKGQLTALFLILTLVPAVVVTVISTRRLMSALSDWHRPGIQNALDKSLDVSVELMNRTKNDLRQRGQLLAADPVMTPPFTAPGKIDLIRDRLAGSYNLDFAQIYSPEGDLLLEVTRDADLSTINTLPGVADLARRDDPFLESSEHSLLAYFGFAGVPGESEWILGIGIYLERGFYARRDTMTTGKAYYDLLPARITFEQRLALLYLGLSLVTMAVVSIWIARKLAARVAGPVAHLGAGMERVTRGEDGVHVDPRGTEETERLIQTFNAMSTELSRSRRELAQAERLSAWQEVAQRVAHEIKNALTPITFSASRLRKTVNQVPESERERFSRSVATVVQEVEALKRLAASFSELARMPAPDLVPLDLREVVEAAAAAFSEENRSIETRIPPEPIMVNGDRTLLRQAMINLVKNAVEATGEKQHVWIELAIASGMVRVTVEDEGAGWPEEEKEASLHPYVTTKEDGTGLGLSLVQRTVLQHGGRIELDGRPGGGARVILFLPHRSSLKVSAESSPIKERG